jgi:hypothetical protein
VAARATLGVLVAVGLGAALLVAGRAGRERAALALGLGLALAASPIVWLHYLAVLLVVVAMYRPRFGLVWLLPVALLPFPITPGAFSAPGGSSRSRRERRARRPGGRNRQHGVLAPVRRGARDRARGLTPLGSGTRDRVCSVAPCARS